jgi:hypothetical protein
VTPPVKMDILNTQPARTNTPFRIRNAPQISGRNGAIRLAIFAGISRIAFKMAALNLYFCRYCGIAQLHLRKT